MKRSEVQTTLFNVRLARNSEGQCAHLLLGIFHLLYAIAEEMDVFEDEEEETDQ